MNREQSERKTMIAIEKAFTLEEIREAKQALSRHLEAFPEDQSLDMGHILPFLEENAKSRFEAAHHLMLSPFEIKERESILKLASAFRDPLSRDAISTNRFLVSSLRKWISKHSKDSTAAYVLSIIEQEYELILAIANFPDQEPETHENKQEHDALPAMQRDAKIEEEPSTFEKHDTPPKVGKKSRKAGVLVA